jgi:uncharacterized protein YtpQ (UPF0354 family)
MAPAWMEALRDRSGPFFDRALDFAAWKGPMPFPVGALGIRKLAEHLEAFAHDDGAPPDDETRFIEGAGSMLAMLLLAHVGLGGHREEGKRHRLVLGRRGFFDPFAAVDEALDAKRPSAELARRVAVAEAEAGGSGPISRLVLAFELELAEQRPDLQIEQQFELELTLTGNVAVDLRRIAATTEPDARSVREAAKKLATLLPGANGSPAVPWVEARDILLPRIVSGSFLDEIKNAHESGGALAARALVGDLHVALVLGYEGRARYVREDEVATWIVGEQGAHDQALANLARRSVAARFSEVLTDAGVLVIARSGDGLDAARLLLPGLFDVLSRVLEVPIVVGVPHRDTLVAACARGSALEVLRARVADDAARAPHSISTGLFEVTREGLRPFA